MKAQVLKQHGGISDISFEHNWPDPTPTPDDVIIRVRACSLNYHDIFTMRGMPGIKVPLPIIMGIDFAGDIVELGRNVKDWKKGDRVVIDPIHRPTGKLQGEMMDGGLAEFARVDASQLIALPDDTGYATAAPLPTAYGTAHRMLITRGNLREGEKVLILGASGGVGTCCVQLAHMVGAHTIVAASTDKKIEELRKLGADFGINYAQHDFADVIREEYGKPRVTGGGGVDVIVNFTGGDTWVPSLRSLTKGGRMLTCGATAGYDPKTDIRYIWTFEHSILGSNGWQKQDIERLIELTAENLVTPAVSDTFNLAEADQAFRKLEGRDFFGKLLITP